MGERVRPSDAIWLQESPANPMMINAVILLERIRPEDLRTVFRQRILEGPSAPEFLRLRCRIAGTGRWRRWGPDPGFDLRRHIVPGRIPAPRGIEGLQVYLGGQVGLQLPPEHPQWEIQVLSGVAEDTTALLVRVHHSIGDGAALLLLLGALMDPAAVAGRASRSPGPAFARPWVAARFIQALSVALKAPGALLSRLTWIADRSELHGQPLSGRKRVAWTEPLDLDVLRQAKRRAGATVNDVLMACVSDALSGYLARRRGPVPSRFLVSMTVNLRPPWQMPSCDNRFAPVPLALPAGRCPSAVLIPRVKAAMDRMKCAAVPQVIDLLQQALLALLPDALSRLVVDFLADKCTAVVTNVIGPDRRLALEGRRVSSILFWVPQRAGIGLGISILSYAGKVQVGMMADTALMPDPAALARCFERSFEALKAPRVPAPAAAGTAIRSEPRASAGLRPAAR